MQAACFQIGTKLSHDRAYSEPFYKFQLPNIYATWTPKHVYNVRGLNEVLHTPATKSGEW